MADNWVPHKARCGLSAGPRTQTILIHMIFHNKNSELENSVTVLLKGGLGNQLFQFATARAFALRNGIDRPTLDLGWFNNAQSSSRTTKRNFELGFLDTASYRIASESMLRRKKFPYRYWKSKQIHGVRQFTEPSLSFHPQILRMGGPLEMDGYFQSEKYFRDFSDSIRADFAFKSGQVSKKIREAYSEMAMRKSLAIHVRRGDYVTNRSANQFHGTLDVDYYERSIRRMLEKTEFDRVYVFSDDPAWVSNQPVFKQFQCVEPSPQRSIDDLWLMSACHSFIIANSSFSWWGAWLGSAPDKKISYPWPWFLDTSIGELDLIPSTWERITR